jgi:hypothetical protein
MWNNSGLYCMNRAEQIVEEARKKDPNALSFPENEVNAYGYQRLQEGNTKEAIDIFKLNVAAFPDSPNAYDSLSDHSGVRRVPACTLVARSSQRGLRPQPKM